jgi:BirA family biotin operon repressor/biotin-[acetyl-CoA-carboxylase] ligase
VNQELILQGHNVIWKKEIDSTNTECQRLWNQEKKMWVVLAERQTQGRGRHGHIWQSTSPCNLYLSVIHKNPWDKQIGLLNLYYGVAVYETLIELFPDINSKITLKWPNDLYISKKKLAGILLDSLDYEFEYIVFGLGLNVACERSDMPEIGTVLSLESSYVDSDSLIKIVQVLIEKLDHDTALLNADVILDKFKKYSQKTCIADYCYKAPHYEYTGRLYSVHNDGTVDIVVGNTIISLKD